MIALGHPSLRVISYIFKRVLTKVYPKSACQSLHGLSEEFAHDQICCIMLLWLPEVRKQGNLTWIRVTLVNLKFASKAN